MSSDTILRILKAAVVVVIFLAVVCLGVFLLQVCWNGFFPGVFGFPEISYIQAWCLFGFFLVLPIHNSFTPKNYKDRQETS